MFRRVSTQVPLLSRRKMSFTTVSTPHAPAAVGPYSQAIKTEQFVFFSGSIPVDPETKKVVDGGVEEQAKQALKNMSAVAEASGVPLTSIVKTTVFIKDMNDFGKINAVYAAHFGDHKPARSCVEVARLPLDVLFEIEAIAVVSK
ncbi:endoribonuclease L-PSP [Microbotryum lychnidis-dioicae p1A1 Lamole]|uniref:Endoribonuclease L-PSP n=1 Tax=Microbotryum lychnidis-dioicae (strain p1A1 Lamole / MvSl-1064) TaxID=683840 RepID=U5H6J1_USTV1|nr:endoribonuclease L-PSP [Microbotryum lychnidis-dioicae p1A1 Lamole]|eukprot:KDE06855.1 endoribonuclease L-PSP [Microbotryum lychnidis-dioicae p1A1 Lamole]